MTLTELRYLLALDKEKNFSKAAASCHVSQPTLSAGIKKLEDSLGVILFERSYHEVQTTHVGQQIIKHALEIFSQVQLIKQLAKNLHDPFAQPLHLGVIYTISSLLLSKTIAQLRQEKPNLKCTIEENYTHHLCESLERGEIDAAIVALPYAMPNLNIAPIGEEPFVAVLPAQDPFAKKSVISIEDLEQRKLLVLAKGNCLRDQILNLCPQCNWGRTDEESVWMEAGSLETIRHMIAMGAGVSIFPAMNAHSSYYNREQIISRPFTSPSPSRTLALVWRKTDPRTPVFELLVQILKKALSKALAESLS